LAEDNNTYTHDELLSGSLLRIADAQERMADAAEVKLKGKLVMMQESRSMRKEIDDLKARLNEALSAVSACEKQHERTLKRLTNRVNKYKSQLKTAQSCGLPTRTLDSAVKTISSKPVVHREETL